MNTGVCYKEIMEQSRGSEYVYEGIRVGLTVRKRIEGTCGSSWLDARGSVGADAHRNTEHGWSGLRVGQQGQTRF